MVLVQTAAGICLVFLVVSLMVSSIQEAIESFLQKRASLLEGMMQAILSGGGVSLLGGLANSPQFMLLRKLDGAGGTKAFEEGKKALPAYINADTFSSALLQLATAEKKAGDVAASGQGVLTIFEVVKDWADTNKDIPLVKVLAGAIDTGELTVQSDAAAIKAVIEDAYNKMADALLDDFKAHVRVWLFGIGLCVAVAFNVDALAIGNTLLGNPVLREGAYALANDAASKAMGTYNMGDLPTELIGWTVPVLGKLTVSSFLAHIPGWLVTAFACILGAQFWFDTLKRFVNIRAANAKPE